MAAPIIPPPYVGLNLETVARIGLGEAGGAAIWGSENDALIAQMMVMWVVRNQYQCPWFPQDYDPLTQFYGAAEQADFGARMAAFAVLYADRTLDPTNGALHVLSEQDRINLCFPPGDIALKAEAPNHWLHFYNEWPVDQEETKECLSLREQTTSSATPHAPRRLMTTGLVP